MPARFSGTRYDLTCINHITGVHFDIFIMPV